MLRNSVTSSRSHFCFSRFVPELDVRLQLAHHFLRIVPGLAIARFWEEQGKRKEAQQLLAKIYGWFTEGFDTADLKEAALLLKELS